MARLSRTLERREPKAPEDFTTEDFANNDAIARQMYEALVALMQSEVVLPNFDIKEIHWFNDTIADYLTTFQDSNINCYYGTNKTTH